MTQQIGAGRGRNGRPRKKGRHPWRRLIIALLVIIGLLVAADFGAAAAAEYQVSKKLRTQLDLSADPQVMIHGFPFLTQAFGGDYRHVTVDAKGVHLGDRFRDLQIHADLYDTRVALSDVLSGSLQRIPIDRMTGRITVDSDDIGRMLAASSAGQALSLKNLTIAPATKQQVRSDSDSGGSGSADSDQAQQDKQQDQDQDRSTEDGKHYTKTAGVRMGADIDFAGEQTQVTVLGFISLADGKIKISPHRVKLSNDVGDFSLPPSLVQGLLANFALTIDPGSLPFHATPLGIDVQPGSLSLEGEAHDVVIDT